MNCYLFCFFCLLCFGDDLQCQIRWCPEVYTNWTFRQVSMRGKARSDHMPSVTAENTSRFAQVISWPFLSSVSKSCSSFYQEAFYRKVNKVPVMSHNWLSNRTKDKPHAYSLVRVNSSIHTLYNSTLSLPDHCYNWKTPVFVVYFS